MADLSGRDGQMLHSRTLSYTRIKSQCQPGTRFFTGSQSQDDLHGEGGRSHADTRLINLRS